MNSNVTADAFALFMQRFEPFSDDEKIMVAVSGGADSMALSLLLAEWAKDRNIKLYAVTVDHKLREESAREAEQVKFWLSKKNIEHHTLEWKGEKPENGIQAAARQERYRLLTDWCKNNDVKRMFVAHHMDDQAETFLLRLFRGSGVYGLSAMSYETEMNGVSIVRPLLDVKRKSLEETCKRFSQDWVEDPSNEKDKYQRVRIRKLLAMFEEQGLDAECFSKTAKRMQRAKTALEHDIDMLLDVAVEITPYGAVFLEKEKLFSVPEEIGMRSLVRILQMTGGESYPPRFEKLERLYNLIKEYGFSGHTLYGCIIRPARDGKIVFFREFSAITDVKKVKPDTEYIWDERFLVKTLSSIEEDLEIRALGMDGWKEVLAEKPKAKKIDIPAEIKYTLPAFFRDGKLFYVPFLEYPEKKDVFFIKFQANC